MDGNDRSGDDGTAAEIEAVRSAEEIAADLEHTKASIASLSEQVNELEAKVRLARGTGNVAGEAATAVAEAKPSAATLVEQVEVLLRQQIMTTDELARAVGQPRDRVLAALKSVRAKVHNLGAPDRARWSWRLGNEARPADLRALVERLISHAPMEFRDLVTATGAREGLIQGHLVEIRKTKPVVDLGTPGRARWFLMPEGARDARLERHRKKQE